MPKEGYVSVGQLLKVTCHYCGRVYVIDPTDMETARITADFLKVQSADGANFAFCNVDCAKSGLKWFKKNPLTYVGNGQFTQEEEVPEIVLTDGE